jgi:hypothetical protein
MVKARVGEEKARGDMPPFLQCHLTFHRRTEDQLDDRPGRKSMLLPPFPEGVKNSRPGEIEWPGDARGREKFTPPKQAVISPWPARYLNLGSRIDHPFVLISVFSGCRRRSAEVGEALHGHATPAGFWSREFLPSPGNNESLRQPPSNSFAASPLAGEGQGGEAIR